MSIESAITTLETQGLWHGHVTSCRALAEALSESSVLSGYETKDIIRKAENISRLGKTRHNRVLDAGARVGLWKRSEGDEFGIERSLSTSSEDVPEGVVVMRRGTFLEVPEVADDELGFYEGDPALRELALRDSSCFGGYTEGHKECGACPLRAFCAETLVSRIEAEAAVMERELADNLAALEAEAAEPEASPEGEEANPEVEGEEATPASNIADMTSDEVVRILSADGCRAKKVKSPFSANCSADCGAEIAAGSEGVSVTGHGFYHAACALKAHG